MNTPLERPHLLRMIALVSVAHTKPATQTNLNLGLQQLYLEDADAVADHLTPCCLNTKDQGSQH